MDCVLTAVICIPVSLVMGIILAHISPDAGPPASIVELSKNEAFAAFIGAFAAYMLIVLTDWRRRRVRVRKSLPGRIASIRLFASEASNVLGQILDAPLNDPVIPLSFMRLSPLGLQEFAADLNDQLTDPQRVNVQSVCFLIEALNTRVAGHEREGETYFAKYHQTVPPNAAALSDLKQFLMEVQVTRSMANSLIRTCDGYPNE